jgi:hypothetical protein
VSGRTAIGKITFTCDDYIVLECFKKYRFIEKLSDIMQNQVCENRGGPQKDINFNSII